MFIIAVAILEAAPRREMKAGDSLSFTARRSVGPHLHSAGIHFSRQNLTSETSDSDV